MSSLRYIAPSGLQEFMTGLAGRGRLLAPVQAGASVVFGEYAGGEPCLARATVAPKEVVLPACESLFSFEKVKENSENASTGAQLGLNAPIEARPTIIFAARPCDARGISVLDRPYLHGPFRDPYYEARRNNLLVISQTCNAPCATCFCDWLGSGPDDSEGSDLLLTRLDEGFVLEAVSPAGEELLAELGKDATLAALLQDGAAKREAMQAVREASKKMRPPAPELGQAPAALRERFGDLDFWREMTAHCLSCGACTYMCPTCYCFNISDEQTGLRGRRLRSWDSCMSSLFTREASGHNPRTEKALRMRNRVLHKFSYYPTVWDGHFSCSGCGRCIVNCPVQLDIRQIVLAGMAK